MRSRLLLLPVLAALPFLPGCFWWGMAAGSEASESGSATVEAPAETDAEAAVRSAIPAIEAYYADNQTYAGAERAGVIYGVPLGAVRIVVQKKAGLLRRGSRGSAVGPLRRPRRSAQPRPLLAVAAAARHG